MFLGYFLYCIILDFILLSAYLPLRAIAEDAPLSYTFFMFIGSFQPNLIQFLQSIGPIVINISGDTKIRGMLNCG